MSLISRSKHSWTISNWERNFLCTHKKKEEHFEVNADGTKEITRLVKNTM